MRHEFARKWGADVYTALQMMFKKGGKKVEVGFEEFREVGRELGVLWNEQEFVYLWRRSKREKETVGDLTREKKLSFEDICEMLLTTNFKPDLTPPPTAPPPTPSYKTSKWR